MRARPGRLLRPNRRSRVNAPRTHVHVIGPLTARIERKKLALTGDDRSFANPAACNELFAVRNGKARVFRMDVRRSSRVGVPEQKCIPFSTRKLQPGSGKTGF